MNPPWPVQVEEELRLVTRGFQADPVIRRYAATEEGRAHLDAEARVMQLHVYDIVGQQPADGGYVFTYRKRVRPTDGRTVHYRTSEGLLTTRPPRSEPSIRIDWGKVAMLLVASVIVIAYLASGWGQRPDDGGTGTNSRQVQHRQLTAEECRDLQDDIEVDMAMWQEWGSEAARTEVDRDMQSQRDGGCGNVPGWAD